MRRSPDAERLEAIKERLSRTTPGDWKQGLYHFDGTAYLIFCNHKVVASTDPQPHPSARKMFDFEHDLANTTFFAHSKDDITWLIEQLEQR